MIQPESHTRAAVVHTMPGRTRLRIAERRNQPDFFTQLAASLRQDPRVRRVSINARAASVLIEHEGAIEPIVAGHLDLNSAATRAQAARASPGFPVSVNTALWIGLAALQLRRGRVASSAVENIWNAWRAWRHLDMPQLAAALLATGIVQMARGRTLAPAISMLFYAMSTHKLMTAAANQTE